jgi:hypothetical protein
VILLQLMVKLNKSRRRLLGLGRVRNVTGSRECVENSIVLAGLLESNDL